MKPTRRELLKSTTVLGAASALGLPACGDKGGETPDDTGTEPTPTRPPEPEAWEGEGTLDTARFPLGLQVGDATATGAVLSAATTEEAVTFVVVAQDGEGWTEVARIEGVAPDPRGHAQHSLEGLAADTAHSAVALSADGSARSGVSRFRTALDGEGWRVVVFGATSCLGGNEPWPSMSALAAEDLDFFCLLGDTIYADNWSTPFDYGEHWRWNLGLAGLQDLSARTSFIATWDDHEVDNNWSWEDEGIDEKFEEGRAWFRSMIPQRQGPGGTGIWRSISYGAVLEVFVLDGRGERTEEAYLSTEQLDWLKAGLAASTARFKIILNSVPITDLAAIFGNTQAADRWQGYPGPREEILSHIDDEGITGVLWVTGDLHYAAANHVSPEGEPGASQWEIMAGPGGSFLNVAADLFTGDPQFPIVFAEWNCTRFECDPGAGTIHVSWIGDDGGVLAEITLEP